MERATLGVIAERVDNIIKEVDELKLSKADKSLIKADLRVVKDDIASLERRFNRMDQYARYFILLIAGALITACLQKTRILQMMKVGQFLGLHKLVEIYSNARSVQCSHF